MAWHVQPRNVQYRHWNQAMAKFQALTKLLISLLPSGKKPILIIHLMHLQTALVETLQQDSFNHPNNHQGASLSNQPLSALNQCILYPSQCRALVYLCTFQILNTTQIWTSIQVPSIFFKPRSCKRRWVFQPSCTVSNKKECTYSETTSTNWHP